MFPISDSAKTKGFPIFNILIILLNIYVFYLMLVSPNLDQFIFNYAFIPSRVNFTDPSTLVPFLTSMFLHGGFLHIISNMWFLWIFGDNVEEYIGHIKYAAFYLVAGVAGSALQYLLNTSSDIPSLGASGAVSGILGAYYVLFPHSRVKTLIFIFLFFTVIEIPAVIYLFYWFFLQLFSGVASLNATQAGGIAFWAHIGGFLTGILFAKMIKNEKSKSFIEGEIIKD